MMSSFLTFFHSLLSQGIIPEEDFHVMVWYGNGYCVGKCIQINDTIFTSPVFDHVNDETIVEKSKVNLSSLYHEYKMEYSDGAWHLVKEWHRPVSPIRRPPSRTNT